MCRRTWHVLHALLTLAVVACCVWLVWKDQRREYPARIERAAQPEVPRLYPDDALRAFLNLRSVGGTYRLPEGESYGAIALLLFEDGKFRGRKGAWHIAGVPEGANAVSYQFVWGRSADGGTRLVTVFREPGGSQITGSTKDDPEFLAKLDGMIISVANPSEEVRGYRILAHVSSAKLQPGKPGLFGTFARELENRQSVAVVGVKTFPTEDQAADWLFKREPGDP